MATNKGKKKTTTKKKTSSKKTNKKNTQNNVDYYEIKLFILIGYSILSVFSLHTDLIGPVGKFIKTVYLGLFSYAGFFIPYIILFIMFYKLNNRLITYRKKAIVGFVLLFISIIFIVNIMTVDNLKHGFIEPKVSLLKISSIIQSFEEGVSLVGSGYIGNLLGKIFVGLIDVTGLYILISTLWVISIILITNVKITELVKNFIHESKNSYKENKDIKQKANEKYIKESEKLEAIRIKEQEKIRKEREAARDDRSSEKMDKALEKVEKRLKAEEKSHVKSLEEYDAMFDQSPTRSILDKLTKKTAIPSKEHLQAKYAQTEEEKVEESHKEKKFEKYSSKGFSFDETFKEDKMVEDAPDIFDNHLETSLSEEELNIPITGFGAIVNESIKKAYEDHEPSPVEEEVMDFTKETEIIEDITIPPVSVTHKEVKEEIVSTFDQAFIKSEETYGEVLLEDDIFENGMPMSDEEKENANKFDQVISGNYEESQIPDVVIEKHMNDRVQLEFENYSIPEIQLLEENKTLDKDNKAEIYEKAKKLEEILENFNIDAKVIQISKGPAITRYEIELKPGIKLSKITNLSDDIALNLATQQVRIAAVPNKAAVGIEVPNESTSIVTLREVLETDTFSQSKGKLSAGLGKNIAGAPIVADLAKMPHMLIAGATGSGKSVCVNTLITSILLNTKPDEVKFLMIDPKVVELNAYNGIPHLILPVVTDPKKASVALNWAVQEMTRRYNAFAEHGVRDIKGYNKRFGEDKTLFMPQIVVIIDELADLMMVAPNQVEDAICRLAQMARAAGIHLIVATQRPSVDVITGVIKANIPSRIAFAVSSAIDSRTIIDMSGAEKLLGKGDMLYYPVGSAKPQRVQGAFISDEEVETIVDAVKNQFNAFTYDENLLKDVSTSIKSTSSDEDDEHLGSAIKLVVEMEQASISMLQRKFKIGYNRAARLVDEMEERGIVGPSLGSKPRQVLISKSELES